MNAHNISTINKLSIEKKREIYKRVVPAELLERFDIDETFTDDKGNDLLKLNCPYESSVTEMSLYHQVGFQDPILYGQITDTLTGKIHVLLYILNDPNSLRFDVDTLPDGTPTLFGTHRRNIKAEIEAMQYGLAPGQIRRGLRLLGPAIQAFEVFISSLGSDMYFAEPLYYHNAVLFERYGFAYEKGRKLMQRIQSGFSPGGDLIDQLDSSTPFRQKKASDSIRLRSWAIHDNILSEPFNNVTMYKWVGKSVGLNTCPDCCW